MKYLLFIILVFFIDPDKIGKVNSAKSEAKKAYERGEYKKAADQYKMLVDSLGVKEDEVSMNLAHSYFKLNDTTNAYQTYMPLASSDNHKIKSLANQQLGVIANRQGKFEEALNFFKNALKADPNNEDARYNYEMVKKKLEEKKKQEEEKNKQKPPEPSEYAKKLKAQADLLVIKKRYTDAFKLMSDGLKKDKTVAHYNEFIKRTKSVSEIK